MALRDQPYIPLYVQDYLSDEKLSCCSLSTQGVYIRIMCVLHKSETYGGILFKQIPKQNLSSIQYFAYILSKQTGVECSDMVQSIEELLFFEVLKIEERDGVDFLFQKRMIKDFNTSINRSNAGKKGGGNPNLFKQNSKQTDKQDNKQTDKQNTEYEYEYNNIGDKDKEGVGEKGKEEDEKQKSYRRFNEWIDTNIPYIRKIKNQITFEEYCRLTEKYNGDQIRKVLTDMSNYKESPKKYVSVNLTFQNWAKKEYGNG